MRLRLSARFAVALLALVAVTGVPVAVHDRGLLDTDRCQDPAALRTTLLIPGSRPIFEERDPKPREILFAMGELDTGARAVPPLRYAIARSFDPTWITGRPAGLVLPRLETQERAFRWEQRNGESLPIHWLHESSRAVSRFAAYFFVVDGRPVKSPTTTVLGDALERLVGGARPLGVVVIGGAALARDVGKVEDAAEDWLFAAWDHYRTACGYGADPV